MFKAKLKCHSIIKIKEYAKLSKSLSIKNGNILYCNACDTMVRNFLF